MQYLIGTDVGTSSTKCILMDTEGNLIAQALQEYDVLTPKPLWAEQWPDVWLKATQETIRSVVEQAKTLGISVDDIKGMGLSGLYGGSGIPLNKNMKPVRPALIWMDRRAQKEADWVKSHIDNKKLADITGNDVIDPYYGYTKILWIKENEPKNWEKTTLFLPPSNYIIYRLTGQVSIDHSAAGNIGGIYDINTHTWSYEMLDAMGIPRYLMPETLVDSTTIVGQLTESSAKDLGLAPGLPLISGGIDVGAANVGMGVFSSGRYVAAIGSSMNAALVSKAPVKDQSLIVWPYPYKSKNLVYNFSGAATAGALVKWFRDNFGEIELIAQHEGGQEAYDALAKTGDKIEPGSDGLIALPYFMGERAPVWDSDAKGVLFGLSLAHTKFHIYHAIQEAVCYALRHSIESTGRDLGDYIIIAGGVTKSKAWVQMFADVTGYPVRTPIEDTEANLGDVMLIGLGTGILTEEKLKTWQVLGDKVMPNQKNHTIYNQYYKLYRKLYNDLSDITHDLSNITLSVESTLEEKKKGVH